MLSNYDDEKRQELDRLNQKKVKRLKKTVANINWKIEEERRDFHRRLCPFISDWESPFPNLRDIFNHDQIEWLFMEDVNKSNYGKANFVDFAIKAGYIDEFVVIKSGKLILRRVTPIHHAGRNPKCSREVVDSLFKIYNKFDRNYIDEEFGLTHFQVACMFGCVEAVEKFLELGQDPNQYPMAKPDPAKSIDPPLHLALERKHAKIVELLMKKGADPSLVNVNGMTPVHVVCQKADEDDDEVLELFFQVCDENHREVQIDARDKLGNTPLHLALIKGKKKVAELLLRKGANANLATKDGYTPLHLIGKYTDDDDLPEMFFKVCDEQQLKVRVDARDKSGNTPLHLALMHEHKWVAESLLKHGAVPALANDSGKTALLVVCEKGASMDIDSMEMLFAYSDKRRWPLLIDGRDASSIFDDDDEWTSRWRVDARDESGRTPLHLALVHGRLDAVDWLLRRGADPNATDEDGSTLLHILSRRSSDIDLAKMFFEICDEVGRPLQVDVQDKRGNTPLHLALTYNSMKMAELLLSRGADPNSRNKNRETPLFGLCRNERGSLEMAELLFKICDELHKSVEVDARDRWSRTPLSLALTNGDERLVELLLKRGACPNTADDDGLTVLHLICRREYDFEMAKLLFGIADEKNRLVQVNREDKWGRTPLQYAVANLYPEMIDVLLDRGADLSNFVFPTRLDFVWFSKPHVYKRQKFMNGKTRRDFEFERAMPLVLQSLEKRGYQLGRYGALTIIQILDFKIVDEPVLVETYRCCNCENFASKATITPRERQKWRGFFLHWAVEFFRTLTRYRLSKSSCERIVERLTNVDLVNICLTGKGPDSREEQEFQYRRLRPRLPPRQERSRFDPMPFHKTERFYM